MVFQKTFTVPTRGHGDMHDVTIHVSAIVREANVTTGIVHVFNVGSTASIGTIEFEPGLMRDLPTMLDKLLPPSREYGHEQTWKDGNAHSHLQATAIGPDLTVPISGGDLRLGTWQQIFLLECDTRSRKREVIVTVIGE